MKVPRLGVGSERPLPAYTTATAMQDPSRVCDPHHHSRHRQIPDPLGEARDSTHILADARGIPFRCATMGTPSIIFFISWMWKLRPREVMRLAQGHPAKKWCTLGSRPSPLSPKARVVSFALHCAFKSRASCIVTGSEAVCTWGDDAAAGAVCGLILGLLRPPCRERGEGG